MSRRIDYEKLWNKTYEKLEEELREGRMDRSKAREQAQQYADLFITYVKQFIRGGMNPNKATEEAEDKVRRALFRRCVMTKAVKRGELRAREKAAEIWTELISLGTALTRADEVEKKLIWILQNKLSKFMGKVKSGDKVDKEADKERDEYLTYVKQLIRGGMNPNKAAEEALVSDEESDSEDGQSEESDSDTEVKPMSPPKVPRRQSRNRNTLSKSDSYRPEYGGAKAGSASTPAKVAIEMTSRYVENLDRTLNKIAEELEVRRAKDDDQAKYIRAKLLKSAENVTGQIQHIVENSLNLTTPQYVSATTNMRSGHLKKGTVHIYIAAYAWPDTEGAISTKKFLEDLIVSDNFGAFTAILQDTRRKGDAFDSADDAEDEFNKQFRANPAFGYENFLNMWLTEHRGKTEEDYSEEEFQKWFHLDHLFKLGMCWRQNAKKRELSYRTIGELSIGIRRYFPIVYEINWARWSDNPRENLGPGTNTEAPRQERVANVIEEYLQRLFLPDVDEKRPSKRRRKPSSSGMLNEEGSANRRMLKWEYIFNQSLDNVAAKVEKELDEMRWKNGRGIKFEKIDGVHTYIESWKKIGDHGAFKQLAFASQNSDGGASQDSDGWESTQPLDDYSQELHKKIIKLRF